MSGFPSSISVVRFIPQHLLDGYSSDALRLWGGVLRHHDGRIAGFVTEGWGLARQVQEGLPINPAQITQAVGNAQMAAQLATGIGVLNLGVQVAGFAMMARRLDRIAGQIEAVRDELRGMGEGVEWLKLNSLAALRADAAHAIAVADRASRREAPALYDEAKSKADHARRHLMNLLGEMLVNGTVLPQHRLYDEFMKMAVLLAAVESRCDEAVEGAGQAAKELTGSAGELRRLAAAFTERSQNFRSSPRELLRLGPSGRAEVKATASRVSSIVGRLEAYVPQLEMQDTLGLDAKEWCALTAPEGDALLSCITFTEHSNLDLVEAVRTTRIT